MFAYRIERESDVMAAMSYSGSFDDDFDDETFEVFPRSWHDTFEVFPRSWHDTFEVFPRSLHDKFEVFPRSWHDKFEVFPLK